MQLPRTAPHLSTLPGTTNEKTSTHPPADTTLSLVILGRLSTPYPIRGAPFVGGLAPVPRHVLVLDHMLHLPLHCQELWSGRAEGGRGEGGANYINLRRIRSSNVHPRAKRHKKKGNGNKKLLNNNYFRSVLARRGNSRWKQSATGKLV